MKVSGVYKIVNTITGDSYIGSSKNVKHRWADHKCPSTWKNNPNKQLYKDMRKYGVDKFELQILAEVESEQLKEKEQQFIETLKPTYNSNNANGWDIERYKETQKEYQKSDKYKKYQKEYQKKYQKEYQKSDKCKEYKKEYQNQLCCYNGEKLTLCALAMRFRKSGVEHPQIEAKKYLL